MKVLVTGGSGFLGINLIRYLLKRGHQVTSLDLEEFDYPEKNRIKHFQGDIRDKKIVTKAMSGVDQVVHCAAALPHYTKKNIFTTDVDGTSVVLEAAKEQKIKRVVHISSTAVYGIPDHHPLKENDKKIGVGPYGEAKVQAEKVAEKYRRLGMCVPILRPKSFIGPERLGVFAFFYEWAKEGHNFPLLGNGKNLYQLLDVEDLCASIYLCMIKEKKIVNDTYNIGAKTFKTIREDYQVIMDKAGYGKKIKFLPAGPAIWILRFLELFNLSPLYKWVYETVGKDSFVSIEKAEKKLGYKPKYSNQQALLRNYQWYLKNENSFKGRSGISHRVPWKQGALKLLKVFF